MSEYGRIIKEFDRLGKIKENVKELSLKSLMETFPGKACSLLDD